MENISYIGLSQQLSLQQQMNMTANNLANMSTPGYKSQQVLFSEYLATPRGGDVIRQSTNSGSYRDLAVGSMAQTYSPFDIAIQGEGYLSVQAPAGIFYTRDGSMMLNEERQLVNKMGYPVLGDGGAPIVIPPEATQVSITPQGEISSEQGQIGRIGVFDFNNPQTMLRVGDNLFDANGDMAVPIENPRLVQGAIETSNVNPVIEMNRMIEVLRGYQSAQRMIQNDHERIRGAIQKLTKV